jgi:hypothetical protein
MKVIFIRSGRKGEAEYDPSTEEYTWSYEGDDSETIDLLSMLEGGKVFEDMDTDDPDTDSDGEEVIDEAYVFVSWDRQIESLAKHLRMNDFDILYLGE